jgi:hypothetical protein
VTGSGRIFGEVDRGHGHGGNAFLAPGEAEFLVGGGLDPDLGDRDAEGFGDALFHGGEVREDLGAFGDEGGIDVHDAAAAGADAACCFLQEDPAGCIPPAFVRVGEEMADVDLTDGPQDGVRDGVEERIGIRVPVESVCVWNLDAAEHEAPPLNQSMDIVTDADVYHGTKVAVVGRGGKPNHGCSGLGRDALRASESRLGVVRTDRSGNISTECPPNGGKFFRNLVRVVFTGASQSS